MQQQHTVIMIAGPTAVGKTAFAIEVAKHFNTEIISADSRQCYREMSIGVARPSEEELSQVKHHFIASHGVEDDVNAAGFEKYALDAVSKIFENNRVAVMTGGTGLYIKAFCEGIDPMPEVSEETRQSIIGQYEQNGLVWLQQEIEQKDPLFWAVAEKQNPQRLMRALEVFYTTGQSIMTYRTAKKAERPFRVIKTALELPKELLYSRISKRVDQMMKDGLAEEVKTLLPYRSYNALQTVGYREMFDHFDGNAGLHDAVVRVKTNTRHYAKRQMTWFKKDKDLQWFPPTKEGIAQVISLIRK